MKHPKKTGNRRHSRGFTLVELAIVMALLALVGVVVVGFVTLVAGQTDRINARTDFMEDALELRGVLERAFAAQDAKDAEILVSEVLSLAVPPESLSVSAEIYPSNAGILRVTVSETETGSVYRFLLASHCGATFTEGGQGE